MGSVKVREVPEAEIPFEDVEIAEPKTMSTNKTVGRFERIEPFTKYYWATIVFGTLLSIPGLFVGLFYRAVGEHWAMPMLFYSVMWTAFVSSEMLRRTFSQQHTTRVLHQGALLLMVNCIWVIAIAVANKGHEEH